MKTLIILVTPILFLAAGLNIIKSCEHEILLNSRFDILYITNATRQKIYFFPVESGLAARIKFRPNFNQPAIESGMIKQILFQNIKSGKKENVKKGDKVIVYWWTEEDKNNIKTSTIIL